MAITNIKMVEIKNLDLNTTPMLVADGTLERSHNVRHSANGVENVCNFTIKETITNSNGFKIIHNHSGNYIAIDSESNIHRVDIFLHSIISKQILEQVHNPNSLSIHHFGNVLIITEQEKQSQYLLKNNNYSKINISDITPIHNPQITYTYKKSASLDISTPSLILGYNNSTDTNKEYILTIAQITDADYIYGSFYMIFAYRMFDGSIIKDARAIQALTESKSETGKSLITQKRNISFPDGKLYSYAYYKTLSGCQPTITFNIDSTLQNSDLIKSIVIFATRPEPIYDFNTLHTRFSAYSPTESAERVILNGNLFQESALNDYAKKPFYEIEEITLGSAISGEIKTTLTWNKHFKDIEHNPIYSPTFSIHNTLHRNMIEYNGRLHTFNQTTKFFTGTSLIPSTPTFKNANTTYDKTSLPQGYTLQFTTIINSGTTSIELNAPPTSHYYSHNFDQSPSRDEFSNIIPIDNFVSYPDYRAESINIYLVNGDQRQLLKQLPLTPSMANNLAYHNNTASTNYASTDIISFDPSSFKPTSQTIGNKNTITTTNKIMVSVQNNPFVFEPKNCYDIETDECEIYSLTTSADELTETSYGQHPLLIFTSKGIFAMEQGSGEVLYSRTIPITNEPQYPNIQNITLNNIVFYTSKTEVRAITSRNSSSVSKILEPNKNQQKSNKNIFEFLKESRLCSIARHDEIMLLNNNYTYAYTYSIKSNSWSTRTISATYLDKHTLIENQNLISTNEKEDTSRPLLPHITTNPLKLSTSSLKKLEHLSPQLSTTPNSPLTITLWASNNLLNWYIVGSSEFATKIGRCGSSWRYFKVDIKAIGTPTPDYYLYLWALEIKHRVKYINSVD